MHRRGSAILGLLGLVALGACGDKFETCDDCALASGGFLSSGGSEATGGSSTGGTEDTGGSSGGGAENAGGAENTGGMGGIPFSCEQCTSATEPVCDEMEEECVQCLPAVDESECVGTNTPVCGPENTCVQCTEDRDNACTTDRPYCSPENECVQCLSGDECTEGSLPICSDGECVPCSDDESCVDLGNVCLSTGECVECSVEKETPCNGNSCDPATNRCTDTVLGGVGVCGPCVADSECEENHQCVPMTYKGEARGGFCLQVSPGCERPYSSPIEGRMTLSGVKGSSYCGINESLTTCEAVVALVDDKKCPNGDECPEGGICRTVGGLMGDRCTYACTLPVQCTEDASPGSKCGGGVDNDSENPDYCGGQ